MLNVDNRREAFRVNSLRPVEYVGAEGLPRRGQMINVSESGARLVGRFPAGAPVIFRVALGSRTVCLLGEQVWREDLQFGKNAVVGVRFRHLEESTRGCLRAFIAREAAA